MSDEKLQATVRKASPLVNIIDIRGDISSLSEKTLIDAYTQASAGNIHTVIFNFTDMNYMNSFGIGLLVTLLIRAGRENKRIMGYGLSEHYQNILALTRLDQAIPIYATQEVALARAEPFDLPERES